MSLPGVDIALFMSADLALSTEWALKRAGHRPFRASSFAEASGAPIVIVEDDAPDASAAVAALLAGSPSVRILVTSTRVERVHSLVGAAAGVLEMPFAHRRLVECIRVLTEPTPMLPCCRR